VVGFALAAIVVVVGAAANGTAVGLHRGDTLVVRLGGNPTTGYRWSPTHVPPPLRLVSSRYVAPTPQRLGQGGTYVFRFRTVAGTGRLSLAYARPWERAKPPLRSFVLTVRVR
jgi:predicted secreted protein